MCHTSMYACFALKSILHKDSNSISYSPMNLPVKIKEPTQCKVSWSDICFHIFCARIKTNKNVATFEKIEIWRNVHSNYFWKKPGSDFWVRSLFEIHYILQKSNKIWMEMQAWISLRLKKRLNIFPNLNFTAFTKVGVAF